MIKIKKGLDLPIAGRPEQAVYDGPAITEVALLGEEYAGMRPSMKVKEGDAVKKGQVLFEDKKNPGVVFTAPASGKIAAIYRGEKRVLQSVVIAVEGNDEIEFERYAPEALAKLSSEEVRRNLIQSGLWTALRTRPFSKIPAVDAEPFAIFVNAMDTNPLAADPTVIIKEAAEDFKREIQVLAEQFEVHRVDGEDFRHRGLPAAPEPITPDAFDAKVEEVFDGKTVGIDTFSELVEHLAKVHPSRYRQFIDGLQGIAWRDVHPITEQAVALRFVVLADRLYDKDLPIVSSGVPFDQVFTPEMLAGGYQKKYFRAVSRLTALAREGLLGESEA